MGLLMQPASHGAKDSYFCGHGHGPRLQACRQHRRAPAGTRTMMTESWPGVGSLRLAAFPALQGPFKLLVLRLVRRCASGRRVDPGSFDQKGHGLTEITSTLIT